MPASVSALSVTLTGLTATEIETLQTATGISSLVATYQSVGQSGNLSDLNVENFNGTVTIRPTQPTDEFHQSDVITAVRTVVAQSFDGWTHA